MKLYNKILQQTIILGDCLDVFSSLSTGSVDTVFMDFPFKSVDGRKDYRGFVRDCLNEAYRICKVGGNCVVINTPHTCFAVPSCESGWILRSEVCLVRPASFFPSLHLGMNHNTCQLLVKENKKTWFGNRVNHQKGPIDVIQYQVGFRGYGVWHPQALSKDITKLLVEITTPVGGTLVDFFGGSGTTPLICAQQGIKSIVSEVEPKYFHVISRRLQELEESCR